MSEVFIPNEEYNGEQPQSGAFGNVNPFGTPLNSDIASGRSQPNDAFPFNAVDNFTSDITPVQESSPTDY